MEQPDGELADGWEEYDADNLPGVKYYYNPSTQESRWIKPVKEQPKQVEPEPQPQQEQEQEGEPQQQPEPAQPAQPALPSTPPPSLPPTLPTSRPASLSSVVKRSADAQAKLLHSKSRRDSQTENYKLAAANAEALRLQQEEAKKRSLETTRLADKAKEDAESLQDAKQRTEQASKAALKAEADAKAKVKAESASKAKSKSEASQKKDIQQRAREEMEAKAQALRSQVEADAVARAKALREAKEREAQGQGAAASSEAKDKQQEAEEARLRLKAQEQKQQQQEQSKQQAQARETAMRRAEEKSKRFEKEMAEATRQAQQKAREEARQAEEARVRAEHARQKLMREQAAELAKEEALRLNAYNRGEREEFETGPWAEIDGEAFPCVAGSQPVHVFAEYTDAPDVLEAVARRELAARLMRQAEEEESEQQQKRKSMRGAKMKKREEMLKQQQQQQEQQEQQEQRKARGPLRPARRKASQLLGDRPPTPADDSPPPPPDDTEDEAPPVPSSDDDAPPPPVPPPEEDEPPPPCPDSESDIDGASESLSMAPPPLQVVNELLQGSAGNGGNGRRRGGLLGQQAPGSPSGGKRDNSESTKAADRLPPLPSPRKPNQSEQQQQQQQSKPSKPAKPKPKQKPTKEPLVLSPSARRSRAASFHVSDDKPRPPGSPKPTHTPTPPKGKPPPGGRQQRHSFTVGPRYTPGSPGGSRAQRDSFTNGVPALPSGRPSSRSVASGLPTRRNGPAGSRSSSTSVGQSPRAPQGRAASQSVSYPAHLQRGGSNSSMSSSNSDGGPPGLERSKTSPGLLGLGRKDRNRPLPPSGPPPKDARRSSSRTNSQRNEELYLSSLLRTGRQFTKHGRKGKPHLAQVRCNKELTELKWGDKSAPVTEIQQVVPGRVTAVFKRADSMDKKDDRDRSAHDKKHKDSYSFSVIFGSRTLDLEVLHTDTPETRDRWVRALRWVKDNAGKGGAADAGGRESSGSLSGSGNGGGSGAVLRPSLKRGGSSSELLPRMSPRNSKGNQSGGSVSSTGSNGAAAMIGHPGGVAASTSSRGKKKGSAGVKQGDAVWYAFVWSLPNVLGVFTGPLAPRLAARGDRQLVRHGNGKLSKKARQGVQKVKDTKRQLWLFSDILVLASPQPKGKFLVTDIFSLEKLHIDERRAVESSSSSSSKSSSSSEAKLTLLHDGDAIPFRFESAEAKASWAVTITQTVQARHTRLPNSSVPHWHGIHRGTLHSAAFNNECEYLRTLLQREGGPDAATREDHNGQTPLQLAVLMGHVGAVCLLAPHAKGQLNSKVGGGSEEGQPAGESAMWHISTEWPSHKVRQGMHALMEAGANPNEVHNGQTLLQALAGASKTRAGAVQELVDGGAVLQQRWRCLRRPDLPEVRWEAVSEPLQSPLHLAARNNNADVVKTLVLCGAPVNGRNEDGDTPLHLTTDVRIAQHLVRHGARVDELNAQDQTPALAVEATRAVRKWEGKGEMTEDSMLPGDKDWVMKLCIKGEKQCTACSAQCTGASSKNCRRCGWLLCGKCSTKRFRMRGGKGAKICCDGCYNVLHVLHSGDMSGAESAQGEPGRGDAKLSHASPQDMFMADVFD